MSYPICSLKDFRYDKTLLYNTFVHYKNNYWTDTKDDTYAASGKYRGIYFDFRGLCRSLMVPDDSTIIVELDKNRGHRHIFIY